MSFTRRLLIVTLAAVGLAGCGPTLEPIDSPGQRIVADDGAAVSRKDVTVTLRQASMPEGFDDGLLAVEATVSNRSGAPVRLTWRRVEVHIDGQAARAPVEPSRLAESMLRSYGLSLAELDDDAVAAAEVHGGFGVGYSSYRGRYYHPYGRLGWRAYGGYPHWSLGYHYYDYPVYGLRERTALARFVMRLWEDRMVGPGSMEQGLLVFDGRFEEPQTLRFVLTLEAPAGGAGRPLPVDAAPRAGAETIKFELRFRVD